MSNLGFFSSKEIYAMLISSFPKKSSEISLIQVMRWCSEVVTNFLRDPAGLITNNKVSVGFGASYEVQNNKVPVPMFMFKLEGVFDENKRLVKDYSYQGGYIYFPSKSAPKKVYIDYTSIPIDEDGFPLIKRGYESACNAYCVYKMFEEDASVIPPKISQWRWKEIVEDKDWEIEAASRSWENINQNTIEEIHRYLISPEYDLIINNNYQKVLDSSNPINHNSNILN